METITTKIIKDGKEHAIILPDELVEKYGIRLGDDIRICFVDSEAEYQKVKQPKHKLPTIIIRKPDGSIV